MPHFLYMSHISPYPIQGGENIRAAGLIRLLSELGPVEAIIGDYPDRQAPPAKDLLNIQLHPFDFQNTMKPVVRYYHQHPSLLQHIQTILDKTPIDCAFIDYQFYGNYIEFFQQQGIPVIYGTHNAEAEMARQEMTRSRGLKVLEKWLLYHLQQQHEKYYFPKADGFVIVSKPDADYYKAWIPAQKMFTLPNFIYPELYPKTQKPLAEINLKKIVVTANFTVFQNIEGIHWFIQKVWAGQGLYEDYELLLVGRGSKEILEPYQRKRLAKTMNATGQVESISGAIHDAGVAVVPILHGSGTRLKILEAMWYQLPIISTPLGAEGIEGDDGKHFILANDPKTFALQIRKLQSQKYRQDLIKNATQLLQERYLLSSNIKRFKNFLNKTIQLHSGKS